MKFYTIMPFRANNPDFMVEEYIRFHKETGLSLLMPSMTMNPEGDTPYEKLHLFIEAFGKLKDKLQGTGIELGILVQALIGHGWSSACPTGIFQNTVNHLNKPRGRICPLDPGFLEYCRFAISNLAKFKPALFMLDDDTRLLDNDKLECFCPLHRAKFSKQYSQEELVELVISAKPGDAILREFETVRRNSLRDFCRNIRAAIDSVDPSIPCGISGPGREQLMFGEMARAAAGPNTRPFVRVGNAMYFEGSAKAMPRRVYQTQVQRMACAGVEDILDESDTYPHNLYSKSVSGMHSHITAALVNGLNGAKLWIENFINAEAGRPNTSYEKYFKEYAGFYEEMDRALDGIVWKGPSVPLPNLEKNFHPKEYPRYLDCKEWFGTVLGRLGFPVTFKQSSDQTAECFLLTQELCNELTSQEIQALVSRNLLLEGRAAESLEQMGYGDTIGVSVSQCPHFSMEVLDSNGINMRLLYSDACRLLKPMPGAKIISTLMKNPFAAKTGRQTIGPGSLIYDNGKTKVASWAGYIDEYTVAPFRKEWLAQILPELCDIPAFCLNEQDIMMRCGIMKDNSVLTALFNLSYDPLTDIVLQCKSRPSKALELLPDGSWREMPSTYQDGKLTLPASICQPYRPVIIKLKK